MVFNAEHVSDPPELNLTFSESLTGQASLLFIRS